MCPPLSQFPSALSARSEGLNNTLFILLGYFFAIEFVELLLVGDQRCTGVIERRVGILGVSGRSKLVLEEVTHAVVSQFGFPNHPGFVLERLIKLLNVPCPVHQSSWYFVST